MSNRIEELCNTVALFKRMIQLLTPPPKITISEWAEKERMLSSEDAASPGPWYNSTAPFLVDIMNAIGNPYIREIVLMLPGQMGKTNTLLNAIGYFITHEPCPIMVVQPTITMGETFSGKRLMPMLRDTPCLRGKVADEKSRTTGNTILEKTFIGGYIVIAGANSAASLKSRPIRICLFDEADEAPEDLEGQGSPIKMAKIRLTRFPNSKFVLASTPTIKNHSHIEAAYDDSTCEHWAHCCPGCGEWSTYSWRRLKFETLMMACPNCENFFGRNEWEKKPGKWIADNPDHPVRGFHLSGLDASTPSWAGLLDEWVESQRLSKMGNHSLLKQFINQRLAETWMETGEAVESHELEKRREVYGAELPDGVCVLTMGVDVQDNRLAYEVVGWGLGFESWGISYGEIFGDPRQGEVWNRIDDLLARAWSYGNGKRIRISRVAVDTGGHVTPQVYAYCKARQSRGVYPIKGQGGDRLPLIRPSKESREKGLFIVGADGVKADIISWLRIDKPGDGFCHFPKDSDGIAVNGYDAAYFAMLTAEARVIRQDKKGFAKYEWIKPAGARNESFDCRCYARAALRIMTPNDTFFLKRLHLNEPWAGQKTEKTHGAAIDAIPKKIIKPKPKINRNALARKAAITL